MDIGLLAEWIHQRITAVTEDEGEHTFIVQFFFRKKEKESVWRQILGCKISSNKSECIEKTEEDRQLNVNPHSQMTKSIDILIDFVAFSAIIIDSTSQFRRDYAIVEQWKCFQHYASMNTITISTVNQFPTLYDEEETDNNGFKIPLNLKIHRTTSIISTASSNLYMHDDVIN